MAEAPVRVEGLVKRYGAVTAVDGIDLCLRAGEVFGLLGPNGAGKSTTIKCIVTLTRPTAGRVLVCGHDVVRAPQLARACLGYVMQERGVDLYLSARENLEVLAGLYHLPRPAIGQRVEEALRQVGLAERADEPVERFSGGMKKRLEIAGGLLHRPRVLLLDEPTLGLDVQTRQHIWASIRRLRAEGMTVLLTTHYLEEADQLCDRIAIIDGGRVRAQGSPAELKAHLGTDRLSIRLAPGRATAPVAAVLAGLAGPGGVTVADGEVTVAVAQSATALVPAVEALRAAGLVDAVAAIDYRRPTLEDVFVAVTGRRLRDAEEG